MVGRGHAAIDRLLQEDFLDIVGREAAFRQRGAHMQAEFIPLAERYHGADHQHAPGPLVEMRPGPDFTPGMARDQVDELAVERIPAGDRFVDPGIAKHLAALRHAVVAAFLAALVSPLPVMARSEATKQSMPHKKLDCFVASLLAMTAFISHPAT